MENKEIDYYSLFSVDKTADIKTIKQKYKKLIKSLHYDKNVSKENMTKEQLEENELQLQLVNQAYSVLSDPESREMYDLGVAKNITSANYNPGNIDDVVRESYIIKDPEKITREKFLEEFEKNRVPDPNDHGYEVERLNKKEDYLDASAAFEAFNSEGNTQEILADKHSGGPSSMLSSNNCTTISEYDGTIIVGTDKDYNGNNFSDYGSAFAMSYSTEEIEEQKKKDKETDVMTAFEKAMAERSIEIKPQRLSWNEAEKQRLKEKEKVRLEEAKKNKEIVDRYKNQYNDLRIKN